MAAKVKFMLQISSLSTSLTKRHAIDLVDNTDDKL